MRYRFVLVWFFFGFLMGGCDSCGDSNRSARADRPSRDVAREEPVRVRFGVVEGFVRLAEGATLPSSPPAPGTQLALPAGCPPVGERDRQPVQLGEGRGLEGVLVAASAFDVTVPHETKTLRIVIRDCRLSPPFLAATRGDRIELTNDSSQPFLARVGGLGMFESILRGQAPRVLELERGGVQEISCGVSASCGRTEIITLHHPVHTLSGAGGRFRLDNVPLDDDLEIHAWHPLFREDRATVTVERGSVKHMVLTLTPAPPSRSTRAHVAPRSQ